MGSGGLRDENGKLVAVVEGDDYPWPTYPEAERKAGITGKMVLSVTLDSAGRVKQIRVIKSLSPTLDKLAADSVRPLKFKRVEGNPTPSLDDLRIQFVFRADCHAVRPSDVAQTTQVNPGARLHVRAGFVRTRQRDTNIERRHPGPFRASPSPMACEIGQGIEPGWRRRGRRELELHTHGARPPLALWSACTRDLCSGGRCHFFRAA